MLIESITILLLLAAAFISFLRQKKYFLLQATLPLTFMPLATVLLNSVVLNLTATKISWNRWVLIFYGAAALIGIVWMCFNAVKFKTWQKRIIYCIAICAFSGLLGWLFINANLI